jgi:NADP-dependent 3-hydroxy acid dehydrogenase YdfG
MIFGAYGGIGAELATRLARQPGARVVLAGRDGAKLGALQERLGLGPNATSIVVDVVDPKQVIWEI